MMNLQRRTRFLGLLILGALLAWGAWTPLQAEPMEGMKKDGHARHERAAHDFVSHFLRGLQRHAKDLGLSGEQTARLKSLSTDYEKTRIRGEADLKLAEVDVQSLVHDDKAELAAIEAAVRKAEAAHTALRLDGIKAVRAATAVLTPEQREKWQASRAARHGTEGGKGEYRDGAQAGPRDSPKKGSKE